MSVDFLGYLIAIVKSFMIFFFVFTILITIWATVSSLRIGECWIFIRMHKAYYKYYVFSVDL